MIFLIEIDMTKENNRISQTGFFYFFLFRTIKVGEDRRVEVRRVGDQKGLTVEDRRRVEDWRVEDLWVEGGGPGGPGGVLEGLAEDWRLEDQRAEDRRAEDQRAEDRRAEDQRAENHRGEDQRVEDRRGEDQGVEDWRVEYRRAEERMV
jgi:hypothetical protein